MTTNVGLAGALLADEPHPTDPDRLALFGQFVGGWVVEWHGRDRAGSEVVVRGEANFGWILGGSAIQDVWRVPSNPSDAALMRGFFGTTVRFYDPAIEAWRSTWIDPLNGRVRRFIGRPTDDGIVLDGLEADPPERWRFTSIGPNSFTWIGEVSADGGSTWILDEVMHATRSVTAPAG